MSQVTFLSGGSAGILAIDGDVGQATGTPIVLNVGSSSSFGTPKFVASGSVIVLEFSDDTLNLGLGALSFADNTTGTNNVALGYNALSSTASGNYNTAVGSQALSSVGVTDRNVAVGYNTSIQGASDCIVIGAGSSANAEGSIAIGSNAVALGQNTIVIGTNNQSLGDNAIGIGFGLTPLPDSIYIGNDSATYTRFNAKGIYNAGDIFTAYAVGANSTNTLSTTFSKFFANGIFGVVTDINDAISVFVDSAGQLGTFSSSARYKEDIQDLVDDSNNIMKLRPVTFKYKSHANSVRRQYGLIAEEVQNVYPDLVISNADGEAETVAYQHLPILMLNEIQKQSKRIDELEKKVSNQDILIKQLLPSSV